LTDARHARQEKTIAQVKQRVEAQVAAFNKNKRKGNGLGDSAGGAGKTRKDRDPNWNKSEILDMVDCKEVEHLEELDMDDSRDLMQPETSKWTSIAAKVNAAGNGPCHQDGAACKYKWQTLLSYYKKIVDFHSGTGVNEEEYWGLTFAERKSLELPRSFYDEVYHQMHG
jgi:hypothetical protein